MLKEITKATRTTRPLIEYPAYFENRFCDDCMKVHYIELTQSNREICHGEDYYFKAQAAKTHYARRLGKGFELVPMSKFPQLPLDWQMAAEANEPEYVDIDQDW